MTDETGHTVDMTTTTLTPDRTAYFAKDALKSLKAWNARADRWFAACHELIEAKADPDPVRYALALDKWNKGRPPSKASKYHAYDSAERLRGLLNLDLPRAQNRDDLKAIAAHVARMLA